MAQAAKRAQDHLIKHLMDLYIEQVRTGMTITTYPQDDDNPRWRETFASVEELRNNLENTAHAEYRELVMGAIQRGETSGKFLTPKQHLKVKKHSGTHGKLSERGRT